MNVHNLYRPHVQIHCTSVYPTHINGTHTDIALYINIYRFMYRYTVPLYTTCTDRLYFCVRNCKLLYNLMLPIHACGEHTWISCTAVCLYCSPVSVHMYCKLVLTNDRKFALRQTLYKIHE